MLAFNGLSATAATKWRTMSATLLNVLALATLLGVVSFQVARRAQRANIAPWHAQRCER